MSAEIPDVRPWPFGDFTGADLIQPRKVAQWLRHAGILTCDPRGRGHHTHPRRDEQAVLAFGPSALARANGQIDIAGLSRHRLGSVVQGDVSVGLQRLKYYKRWHQPCNGQARHRSDMQIVATSAPVTRVTAIGSGPAEALGFGIASLAGSSSPIWLDETHKNGDSVEKTLLALAATRNT